MAMPLLILALFTGLLALSFIFRKPFQQTFLLFKCLLKGNFYPLASPHAPPLAPQDYPRAVRQYIWSPDDYTYHGYDPCRKLISGVFLWFFVAQKFL
jgi:hypothetical protein